MQSDPQSGLARSPESETSSAGSPAASIFEGRLHPLTLAFGILRGLRGILPVIPLLFFSNRKFGWGLAVFIFGGAALTAMVRYFSFSYRIEGNDLITEQGILDKKERHIPLERIQEISIEQGVMHRLLGMVDARIETGGGEGAEATLSVLSRPEADRLREAVFKRIAEIKAGRAAEPVPAQVPQPETRIIRKLGLRELALAGLASNHIVTALVLAGAVWNFADDIFPDTIYQRVAEFAVEQSKNVLSQDVSVTIIVTAILLAAVLLIAMIASIVGSIVLFYDFTLSLKGEDLQRRYGLFTRRASSLPRRRIQLLLIEERPLRRLWRLATLRADISGRKREGRDDNKGRDVLLPVVGKDEAAGLLSNFFPDLNDDRAEWRRVSKLAIRRGTLKGALFCLLAAGLLFFKYQTVLALWPLMLIPLLYWISVQSYRHLGYALGERYFQTRRGWLGRSTHIVPINKIQSVEITQTPFDRRLGLAGLGVDTAGQAYTGGGPQIDNLPLDEARMIARVLAHKAAATRYRW